MTRYRRDSPATDIAGQDVPAPSSAGTIRTSRQAPITHAIAGTIQAMLADSAGQDTHDPIGLQVVRRRVIARHPLIPASGTITSQSCIKATLASSVLQRWHHARSKEH